MNAPLTTDQNSSSEVKELPPPKNSFHRSGYVIIDKPSGFSSAAIVGRVKRTLGAVKVGHAGTLDPDATGLLVCLVNGATKIAPYILEGRKIYEGTIRFGVKTTTDDMAGEIIETNDILPSPMAVQEALGSFKGEIQQVPPRVSAIQIEGRRAYDMERKGQAFDLNARTVHVFAIELSQVDSAVYRYRIECGAGTYIRSLARDIGEILGCGGAVETLRRVASGPVDVSTAIPIEELSQTKVLDWTTLLPHIPIIDVPLQLARDLLQGREYALVAFSEYAKDVPDDSVIYRLSGRDESCGIIRRAEGRWKYEVSAMPQFGLGK
jgi:tRNA pseudouridine55 synthase